MTKPHEGGPVRLKPLGTEGRAGRELATGEAPPTRKTPEGPIAEIAAGGLVAKSIQFGRARVVVLWSVKEPSQIKVNCGLSAGEGNRSSWRLMIVRPRQATRFPVKWRVVSFVASTRLVNETSIGMVRVCTSAAIDKVMVPP